jgi:hypothetical protein
MTTSEASSRPPPPFWCLMTKGEKHQLKLEGLTHVFLIFVLSGKTRLSSFVQQNFYLSFYFLISVDLRTM